MMDSGQLVTEMTKLLRWPATIIIIVSLLRRPLSDLIPLLERLRYRDLELVFTRGVRLATENAESALPPMTDVKVSEVPSIAGLIKLADLSRRAAVLDAWGEIGAAARGLATRRGVKLTDRQLRSPVTLLRALEQNAAITRQQASLLHDLWALRNAAVHAPEFEIDAHAVLDYIGLAARVILALRAPEETQRG